MVLALPDAATLVRALFELTPDAMFAKDLAGRYVLINEAGARFFERPRTEIVGRTDAELLGPERGASVREVDLLVMERREPMLYERIRLVGGKEVVYQTYKFPYLDEAGELIGVMGIAREVTEIRRLEGRMFTADRMASVGTLASGVAHEINNPLAYVVGNIDFARNQLDEIVHGRQSAATLPQVTQALAEGADGAMRISQIVRGLRMFGRGDRDERTPIDVGQVLDVALRLTEHKIGKHAKVVRSIAPLPRVLGIQARLGQVFVQLLVNAAQAMPADRELEQNEIHIDGHVDGERAVVELRDNGVGMEQSLLRRIFDPFFTTRPFHATGLGLWVCRHVMDGMGGELTATSEPHVGSVFRISLPLASG